MAQMNMADFKARLKSQGPYGWYIFAGEEDYLKSHYAGEVKSLVTEDTGLDVFNHAQWSSDEMNFGDLAEAIEAPPMMQEYKLIEWNFANLSALKEKDLKLFTEKILPLKELCPYAVFVIVTVPEGFDAGTEKKPSKQMKLLGEYFDILIFPKSTDAQLLSWLKKHFESEGISVTLDALSAMLARVGHSMVVLKSEVEKLSAYLHANGQTELTRDAVELVTSSNIESEAFALKDAIFEGNSRRAFRTLADMKLRRIEPQVIIGMLAKIYSELSAVSMLADEGESFETMQRLLGMSKYPLQLALKASRKAGTKKINSALAELLRADASAKFGGIAGYQAIELFIVQNI